MAWCYDEALCEVELASPYRGMRMQWGMRYVGSCEQAVIGQ